MDWVKSLNLHLENLLPGTATLILLALLYPSRTSDVLTKLPGCSNDVLVVGGFVSVAYVLGVLIVALSRILDKFSEWVLRPVFLRTLAIERVSGTWDERNCRYREALKSALSGTNVEVKREISRRRERVHLSRAAVVPAILCTILLTSDWKYGPRLTVTGAVSLLMFCVYTYLEIAIYDEASLAKDGGGASDASATGGVAHG